MNDFTIKGSLVKDHINQRSYNLTSKIDAIKLHETLTNYEKEIQSLKNKKTDDEKIKQYLIALQMDISNIQAEIKKIRELMEC